MTEDPSSTKVDDLDIVLRMQYGQEGGLRDLLRVYGGGVLTALKAQFSGTLDELDIEAAFYAAAHKAYEKAHTFNESKGTLRGWFYRIAYNEVLASLREAKKYAGEEFDESFHDGEGVMEYMRKKAGVGEPEEDEPANVRLYEDLQEAIAELPTVQRAIIEADLVVGGSADGGKLAEKLGTSKNSIYVSRGKARENLLKAMIKKGHAEN